MDAPRNDSGEWLARLMLDGYIVVCIVVGKARFWVQKARLMLKLSQSLAWGALANLSLYLAFLRRKFSGMPWNTRRAGAGIVTRSFPKESE